MRVKELFEILSGMNPEWQVVMSADPEGNYFRPLVDHGTGRYHNRTGEWDDAGHPEDEGGCAKKDINAVLLWP